MKERLPTSFSLSLMNNEQEWQFKGLYKNVILYINFWLTAQGLFFSNICTFCKCRSLSWCLLTSCSRRSFCCSNFSRCSLSFLRETYSHMYKGKHNKYFLSKKHNPFWMWKVNDGILNYDAIFNKCMSMDLRGKIAELWKNWKALLLAVYSRQKTHRLKASV